MEQARDLSESWKVDLASQEPMSAQAESLSLVYCRHPDSSLIGDYRTSGGTIQGVKHSVCFFPYGQVCTLLNISLCGVVVWQLTHTHTPTDGTMARVCKYRVD